MKRRHNNFFFGIFLLLGISHPGFTAVYKWVDENGKTHYSDKPVNQQSETIDIKTKSPAQDIKERISYLEQEIDKVCLKKWLN